MANYKVLKMSPDKKKAMSINEFAAEYGLGINKARQIIHAEGFPCIFNGNRAVIIRSKVDEFMEKHIGHIF